MKRKVRTLIIVMVVIASITTVTVLGKATFKNKTVERKIAQGYSEQDVYSMLSIISLCNEKSMPVIEEKYKELGSWDAVVKYYNINPLDYEMKIKNILEVEKNLEIPDDIYEEMIDSGMTDEECKEFSISAFNSKIDIRTVWKEKQKGKTVNDLIKERTKFNNEKLQAATDYTFGKISEKEYIKKMQSLSPDMSMTDIIEFADKENKEWKKHRIKSSGITDKEIELAKKAGMTDVLEMCRLKDAEKFSNIIFSDMVMQVQKGNSVDSVVRKNINAEKVKAIQKKYISE